MSLPNQNGRLPVLPDFWIDLCEEKADRKPTLQVVRPPEPSSYSDRERQYVPAALEREASKVESAPDGTKHDQLLRSSIAIGGFVPIISEKEIEDRLEEAIKTRKIDSLPKAIKTIRDGIKHGMDRPREVP